MRAFVSYYVTDGILAHELINELIENDLIPTAINLKILHESGKTDKVQRVFSTVSCIIVVLSQEYLDSSWMKDTELQEILEWEKQKPTNILIFARIDECDLPEIFQNRKIAFLSKDTIAKDVKEMVENILHKRKVFIIMKFNDKLLDSAHERVIAPVLKEFGYTDLRIDERQDSGKIDQQILEEIERSSLIFADLTGMSHNCVFEVGYAFAFKEKEIILTLNKKDLPPFDIAANRFIMWETEKELETELRKRLESVKYKE